MVSQIELIDPLDRTMDVWITNYDVVDYNSEDIMILGRYNKDDDPETGKESTTILTSIFPRTSGRMR